ncbi:MAG: DUF362 domain-containing protein [Spirochaetales bacterium]|nr:DUF362 domain-containing protein [Spirochaetales bacterium]
MSKKSRVALVRCDDYEPQKLYSRLSLAIELLGGLHSFVSEGESIVLKPNVLVGTSPEKPVGTHPAVLETMVQILKKNISNCRLSYGDSSALGSPEENMRKAVYYERMQALGVSLANFVDASEMRLEESPFIKSFEIARGVTEADGLISIAKMKTHGFMKVTGAVKNSFGCIPGFRKPQFHVRLESPFEFAKMLVSLNLVLKPRLYVLDGIISMEGNGPMNGTPVNTRALMVSQDPVALDSVMCAVMNLDPALVPTNVWGQKLGLGQMDLNKIEILGDKLEDFVMPSFNVSRERFYINRAAGLFPFVRKALIPRPVIDEANCTQCGRCVEICPVSPKALSFSRGKKNPPVYDYKNCISCFCCQEICPHRAILVKQPWISRLFYLISKKDPGFREHPL